LEKGKRVEERKRERKENNEGSVDVEIILIGIQSLFHLF
jgi:hypothetical protein